MVWSCKRNRQYQILKWASELKFKGKSPWDDAEEDGSVRYWKPSRREERVSNKMKRKQLYKERAKWKYFIHEPIQNGYEARRKSKIKSAPPLLI
jgi:hypothetical protein